MLVAGLLLGARCGNSPRDEDPVAVVHPPAEPAIGSTTNPAGSLRVLFAGCDQAGPGPRCGLRPRSRSLVLWVDVPSAASVDIVVDGAALLPAREPEPAEEGWRWHLEIPPEARTLEVRTARRPAARRFVLTLDADPPEPPPSLEAIEQESEDDRDEARRRLTQQLADWTGADLAFGLHRAGKLARDAGDRAAALSHFQRGIEIAEAQGLWTLASQMAQTLFYDCLIARDFECAERWLDRDESLRPFRTADHQYIRGLLAENRGNLADAARAYEHALVVMRALGHSRDPRVEPAVLSRVSLLRAQLGDRPAAIRTIRRGLDRLDAWKRAKIRAHVRAQFLNTAAWGLLVSSAAEQSAPAPTSTDPRIEPAALLRRALELLPDAPEDDRIRTSAILNLAYEALGRQDTEAAAAWLDRVSRVRLPRTYDLWRMLLTAQLARLEGKLGPAQRQLRAMLAQAERHEDHSLRWAAHAELARVLEQRGRHEQALVQYAAAERVLDQQLPFLGLGGRDRLMADRDWATGRHVALRLARGEVAPALCVARLARTRVLRALSRRIRREATPARQREFEHYLGTRLRLDEKYDQTFWEADAIEAERQRREIERAREDNRQRFETLMRALGESPAKRPRCDSLPEPGPGTLDLHYVHLDRGWVGFAVTPEGSITVRPLDPFDPLDPPDSVDPPAAEPSSSGAAFESRWGEILLGPFAKAIEGAQRVRVMPTGELYRVPFHALPFGEHGRALHDHVEVTYGIDLPHTTLPVAPTGTALVLAPPSNLPHARTEARRSAQSLRQHGLAVEHVPAPRSSATVTEPPALLTEQVLALLPTAPWFHYTGHARSRGREGWDSELLLAADQTMTLEVSDVLALPSVPPVVVLNGCETGVTDPQSLGGGMSLAHAFVLGGAQVVIATTREIRDLEAAALIKRLYDALEAPTPAATLAALRHAQRKAAALQPRGPGESAWRSVRAWVP